MKKYSICLLIIAALFTACDHDNVGPEDSHGVYLAIPYTVQDSMFETRDAIIPIVRLYDVNGYLMAGTRSGEMIDTAGNIIPYNVSLHMAQFIDSTGALARPDSVSLNNRKLWPLSNFLFSGGYPGLWNNTGSNQWHVAGNTQVPEINTSIVLPFPQFNTTLPDSIDIDQPFSFTFSSSNLQQADSAFILLYSYTGHLWTSGLAAANGGTVTLDCSASILNGSGPLNLFFDIQGRIYYGGILALVAYRTEIHASGGKNFAYVVETQKVKKVVFH